MFKISGTKEFSLSSRSGLHLWVYVRLSGVNNQIVVKTALVQLLWYKNLGSCTSMFMT